ncbi:C40 family peptidase [Uliginosibacterium sp. H3]|uniref:C40 family peptidase n=1 Tax=Uliginosibacterium silvisoli TaxID=3114758 RepID=A0ABU6K898_9RHOO|nr:C40 family peptidase [Uliginosibacterium sp. H3]
MTERGPLLRRSMCCLILGCLAACSSAPPAPPATPKPTQRPPTTAAFRLDQPDHASEIVIFSLGLLNTGYRFGGSNPDAGLDCSGMVSYVVERVAGKRLPHNAAQIAAITQPIDRAELKPADLVFFNTSGQTYSHMGIYLGDGRFVHAPSSKGVIRIERLDSTYFASRFTGARTLF